VRPGLAYSRFIGLGDYRAPAASTLSLGMMTPYLTSIQLPRMLASRNSVSMVDLEKLLPRPAVVMDEARIDAFCRGKAVAISGGGGSIGSELCRRAVALAASRLMVIENSEPVLYAIMESLAGAATEICGHIADVRDRTRIHDLMEAFAPDVVFHAAALKHVPIVERDWQEGIRTNVFGSVNVADAAVAAGSTAMVMISTDKAAEPVSMLGRTKRFAEMYCQALDGPTFQRTRLAPVRFGNVLASNGSVVPKFMAQITAGGPVTVTHPDMVRYFMTVREACDLVIAAASLATAESHRAGSMYVLDMGRPVRIVDLAEGLIRQAGLEPGRDVAITFTGIRPGEKLNEILFADDEPASGSAVPGIMTARPKARRLMGLRHALDELKWAVDRGNRDAAWAAMAADRDQVMAGPATAPTQAMPPRNRVQAAG
jgi:FlaA1/EpsC-like NDP-sugar epimerase